MYEDTSRKLEDEVRERAKTKTETGKSSTGPDFVLADGSVCLCAYVSETPQVLVLAPATVRLTTESAVGVDLFGGRVCLDVADN